MREGEDARLRSELDQLATIVDAKTANVAVGGLRLQVLGWLLLFAGIALGAIVSIAAAVA